MQGVEFIGGVEPPFVQQTPKPCSDLSELNPWYLYRAALSGEYLRLMADPDFHHPIRGAVIVFDTKTC